MNVAGVTKDLAHGWTIPFDCAPLAELDDHVARAYECYPGLSRISAVVQQSAPDWVGERQADAWALNDGEEVASPLVWRGDELIETALLVRDKLLRSRRSRRKHALDRRRRARRRAVGG